MARTPWDHGKTATERVLGWAWQKQRLRVLKRDMHLCQDCLAKGRPTPAKEVRMGRSRSHKINARIVRSLVICYAAGG